MTNKEKKLAVMFLKMASEEFSRHGCNDLDPGLLTDWSPEEIIALDKAYHEWNGDPEEHGPDNSWLPDFALMSFLAAKLDDEVKWSE